MNISTSWRKIIFLLLFFQLVAINIIFCSRCVFFLLRNHHHICFLLSSLSSLSRCVLRMKKARKRRQQNNNNNNKQWIILFEDKFFPSVSHIYIFLPPTTVKTQGRKKQKLTFLAEIFKTENKKRKKLQST